MALKDAIVRIVRRLFANNAFDRAAAVTFWLFLSVIPLLLIAGFVLGQVVRSHGLDSFLNAAFEVVPSFAEPLLRTELARMAGESGKSIAPLGVLGFIWSAAGGVHSVMDALEVTLEAKPRAWWRQRGISLAWVLGGLIVLSTLGTAFAVVERVATTVSEETAAASAAVSRALPKELTRAAHPKWKSRHAPPAWQRVTFGVAMIGLATALMAFFFKHSISKSHGPLRPWPGALTATLLWVLVSWGFGRYVLSLANYALYYGSLAAVAVLLIWLYLTSLAILVGGEVVAECSKIGAKAA